MEAGLPSSKTLELVSRCVDLTYGADDNGPDSLRTSLTAVSQKLAALADRLEKGEYLYLVVNVPYSSFILVDVHKCDENALTFDYTLEYDSFVQEEFTNQEEIPAD